MTEGNSRRRRRRFGGSSRSSDSAGSTIAGREIRTGRDAAEVVRRTNAGDVVVIDRHDLEPEIARALIAAGAYALINVSTSMSGRFPTAGPLLLVRAGVIVIDEAARADQVLRDGERVQVDGARLRRGDAVIVEGRRRTEDDLRTELESIRSQGGAMVRTEALVADSVALLRDAPDLIDGSAADAALVRVVDGRPAVVVASSWPGEHDDLIRRSAGSSGWAVIAAGEQAARDLAGIGVVPDAVVNPPSVPLRVAGEHAGPPRVASPVGGHDLDATVLSTLLAGAPVVVPIGRISEELSTVLDQPRGGAAVSGVARLVGAGRIVDAEALGSLAPPSLAQTRPGRRRPDQAKRRQRGNIAAVALLALAAGLVLGYGPLNALLTDGGSSDRAAAEAAQAQAEADRLALEGADAIVSRAQAELVSDQLTDRRVVVIVAPGVAAPSVDGVRTVIDQAGGRVSGTIQLTDEFLDPNNATSHDDIALRLAPPEAELPSSGPAGARRDAALAASLIAQGDAVGTESDAAAGFIEAMSQVGALTASGTPQARAAIALMIVPSTAPAQDAVVGLAGALSANGGVVVSAEGLRDASATLVAVVDLGASAVSTSSGVAASVGRVVSVDALADALAGSYANYGVGIVASPAPTAGSTGAPQPTASIAPTP